MRQLAILRIRRAGSDPKPSSKSVRKRWGCWGFFFKFEDVIEDIRFDFRITTKTTFKPLRFQSRARR